MYEVGIAKPVYMIDPRMNIAVGASALAIILKPAAIVRKMLDIVNVAKNEMNRKKKNGTRGTTEVGHEVESCVKSDCG